MRIRVSPLIEGRVHALAIRQGRSDQNMLDKLIEAGLAATGMPATILSPALGDLNDAELTEFKVPLAPTLRASLRELAAKEGRSQRQMAAHVIATGLRALGADPTVVANTVEATQVTA